jgi:hypothetical protein
LVLAITAGTIIDGSGGEPIKDAVLVIEGRRFIGVDSLSTPVPAQAAGISAAGKLSGQV